MSTQEQIARNATVVMLVIGLAAILVVGVGVFVHEGQALLGSLASTSVQAAPNCQQYLDAAVESARQRNLGSASVQAEAFNTMAWVAIYNACRER